MTKYEKDSVVVGRVTGIEKYGIFVSLDNYYSGLIHISEISEKFVNDINDYVEMGETIKARILEVDSKNCHLKLSIKNLDYKLEKNKRKKIVETPLGFQTLKACLPVWISRKKKELIKN